MLKGNNVEQDIWASVFNRISKRFTDRYLNFYSINRAIYTKRIFALSALSSVNNYYDVTTAVKPENTFHLGNTFYPIQNIFLHWFSKYECSSHGVQNNVLIVRTDPFQSTHRQWRAS